MICRVQVRLGGRLVWENKAGWLQTRGGWWLRSLPLHFTDGSLAWGEQSKEGTGTRGALEPRVSPLRPQPCHSGRYGGLELAKAGHGSTDTSYGQGPWQALSPLEPRCSHLGRGSEAPLALLPSQGHAGSDQVAPLPDQTHPVLCSRGWLPAHSAGTRGLALSSIRSNRTENANICSRGDGCPWQARAFFFLQTTGQETQDRPPQVAGMAAFCSRKENGLDTWPRSSHSQRAWAGSRASAEECSWHWDWRRSPGSGASDPASLEKVCRMWTELNFLLCAEQKELLTRRLLVKRLLFQFLQRPGQLGAPAPGETPPWLGESAYRCHEHGCPRWPGSASVLLPPLLGIRMCEFSVCSTSLSPMGFSTPSLPQREVKLTF